MNRFVLYWVTLFVLLVSSLSWATTRNSATDWQLANYFLGSLPINK